MCVSKNVKANTIKSSGTDHFFCAGLEMFETSPARLLQHIAIHILSYLYIYIYTHIDIYIYIKEYIFRRILVSIILSLYI